MMYRPPSTKAEPVMPPNFIANFVKGGWRQVEHMYGFRTDKIVRLRAMAGGERLDRARREYMAGRMKLDEAVASVTAAVADPVQA